MKPDFCVMQISCIIQLISQLNVFVWYAAQPFVSLYIQYFKSTTSECFIAPYLVKNYDVSRNVSNASSGHQKSDEQTLPMIQAVM